MQKIEELNNTFSHSQGFLFTFPDYQIKNLEVDINKLYLKEGLILHNKPTENFFICKLCSGIVKTTKIKCCENCEDLFCNSCFEKWLNKNDKCPKCEISPFKDMKIHKFMKSTIDEMIIKCPFECDEDIKYEHLNLHLNKCENKPKTYICNLCQENININNYNKQISLINNHNNSCAYISAKCKECNKDVLNNFTTQHLKVCEERLIKCGKCNIAYNLKNEKAHEEFYCKKINTLRKNIFDFVSKIKLCFGL